MYTASLYGFFMSLLAQSLLLCVRLLSLYRGGGAVQKVGGGGGGEAGGRDEWGGVRCV